MLYKYGVETNDYADCIREQNEYRLVAQELNERMNRDLAEIAAAEREYIRNLHRNLFKRLRIGLVEFFRERLNDD